MYIFTLAIGADYKRALAKGLASKVAYAEKHNYKYIQGGEEWWDRNRPTAWSKIPFLLKYLTNDVPHNELVWLSDADVLITNYDLALESHVVPLLPDDKDMLMFFDACGHVNSGNILMRNTEWTRDFWKRVYEQTDCIYHIWWENAAIDKLLNSDKTDDKNHVHISKQHKVFNAYLMGLPGEPLWEAGDFLVHFAGVYSPDKIRDLIDEVLKGVVPRLDMYSVKRIDLP